MRTLTLVLSVCSLQFCAQAQRDVETISWSDLRGQGRLLAGEVRSIDAEVFTECLRIRNATGEAATFLLTVIEHPGIKGNQYALKGKVRYEGVEGKGYLESRNWFGDSEKYFSRTLGETGPMKSLEGDSDWRDFLLPFFINDDPKRPTKIEVNLVLPGSGVVDIGPLALVEMSEGVDPITGKGSWWTDQQAGWVGALIGCLGGLFGVLGGIAGSMAFCGRGRGLAFGVLYVMAALGGFSLVAGLSALALSQPYHVYYPLLLSGLLFTALGLGLLPTMRKRYEQAEMRRMKAMDAR